MARLQEQAAQAAQAGASHGPPADRLEKCAVHLRVTAQSIEVANQQSGNPGSGVITQKIKLLNFLREQK
jgi:hypothetical protein